MVYLSLAHLDAEKIKNRFRTIYTKLKEYNFDLCKDLLPVAPAAHYMVGGIRTGLDGETNIEGTVCLRGSCFNWCYGCQQAGKQFIVRVPCVSGKGAATRQLQLDEIDCAPCKMNSGPMHHKP